MRNFWKNSPRWRRWLIAAGASTFLTCCCLFSLVASNNDEELSGSTDSTLIENPPAQPQTATTTSTNTETATTAPTETHTQAPTDTAEASPTFDTFNLTLQANQTQNAAFQLTQNAQATLLALTPTNTHTPIPPTKPPATNTLVPFIPTATQSSGGGGNAVCACTGNLYNCGDFNTQAQAQACHDYCVSQGKGDIHGLDGNDNDGLACESLP